MSLSHESRIELKPSHVHYRAWWMIPLSYEGLAPVMAAFDCVWIIGLSAVVEFGYHAIAIKERGDVAAAIGSGIIVAVLFCTILNSRGLYRPSKLLSTNFKIGEALLIWTWMFVCFAAVAFALKVGSLFSRGTVLLFFGIGLLAVAVSRAGLARIARHVIAAGLLSVRRVVMLTDSEQTFGRSAAFSLKRYGYTLSRVFTVNGQDGDDGSDVTACLGDLIRYVRQRRPDEIILAIQWHQTPLIQRIMSELRAVPVPVRLLGDPALGWLLERPLVELGAAKAVELQRAPLSRVQRTVKRAIDITAAGVGLILLLPVFGLMAAVIRLDSPGPILFQQSRVGFNGRGFRIYKFRTMKTLEDGATVRQVRKDDERITRTGRILRRFSLDELPQLVNVLKGEMSLVGPRPHARAHDDDYSKLIAEYSTRHKMKPGITGWAQVNGCRGETARVNLMKCRVEHDLWYVDHWSVWLDIKILGRTVIHLFKACDVY